MTRVQGLGRVQSVVIRASGEKRFEYFSRSNLCGHSFVEIW